MEAIYGVNMLMTYLTNWLAWRYALNAGLMDHNVADQALLDTVRKRVRIGMLAHAIGPLFSIWNPMVSFIDFMVLGVLLIVARLFSTFEWEPMLRADDPDPKTAG